MCPRDGIAIQPVRLPAIATPEIILPHIRISGASYAATRLTAPFALWFAASDDCSIYFLNGGPAYFECPEELEEPVLCSEGTLLAVTGGQAHGWRDKLKTPYSRSTKPPPFTLSRKTPLADAVKGRGAVLTRITLPSQVFVTYLHTSPVIFAGNEAPELVMRARNILTLMNNEVFADTNDPAAQKILWRLTEILLIFLLKRWLDNEGREISGRREKPPQAAEAAMQRVIKAIQKKPQHSWTLKEMAKEAGMNKTSFCTGFKKEMNVPPAEYLTGVRMSLAAALMSDRRKSLTEIAWEVGYQSVAAFNRAFHRHYEMTPGRYRRRFYAE
jgi:AraC-like DNA-binding protein